MSKDKESEFYTEKAFTELLAYSDCMTRFASQKPGTAFAAASVFFLSAFSWLPSSGEHLRTNDPTRRSKRTPTAVACARRRRAGSPEPAPRQLLPRSRSYRSRRPYSSNKQSGRKDRKIP